MKKSKRVIKAFDEAVRLADEVDEGRAPAFPVTQLPQSRESSSETVSKRRRPRPSIARGHPIDEYSQRELERVVRWIQSDRRLRTDDEIVNEVLQELGFHRRGSRIVEAIRDAIRTADGASEELA